MTNTDAYILREASGTSGIVETARTMAETLAHWDIPHVFVGGLALHLDLKTWDGLATEK